MIRAAGDNRTGGLFSYVALEARVRRDHPLRAIRTIGNEALLALEREFAALYSPIGRPSIPPEKLLCAMLLQAFYSMRSERLLMERLEYDLLFRWFVGIGVTTQPGTIRCSRRTATGCWKATSRPSSWRCCWRSPR
jgi:transposase